MALGNGFDRDKPRQAVFVGMDEALRDVAPLTRSGAVYRPDVLPRDARVVYSDVFVDDGPQRARRNRRVEIPADRGGVYLNGAFANVTLEEKTGVSPRETHAVRSSQMVCIGALDGDESPQTSAEKWAYNKLWAEKYRTMADEQVAAIKKLAKTVLGGGFIDPRLETTKGVYRGTGRGLVEDYPWIKRIATVCSNGTSFWPLRKLYLQAITSKAILFHDGAALWKVKERYKSIYQFFKFKSDMLHTLTRTAINERALDIEFDWKFNIQPKLKYNTYVDALASPAAWAAVAKDTAITVVNKAGGIVQTGVEVVVPAAGEIAETLARETGKSILRHPLLWLALGLGGYGLYRSGALRWGAETGKTLIKRRIGL